LDEIRNGHSERSRHLIPIIRSPTESVFSHFGQLKGKGAKKIRAHYQIYPEEAEFFAKLYSGHWEGYYGGNTANLYAKVIESLEEGESLERKIDIASGPFSLSRKLGVPVTNLDINPQMLNAGRILERDCKIAQGNLAVQGSFSALPFSDSSYDLALCSLALHMSKLNGRDNEREQSFRDLNRVLREGGYGMFTLPHTVISEVDLEDFYLGLDLLGFEVMDLSGFYKGPKDTRFKVFLGAMQKREEPTDEELGPEFFTWKMDRQGKRKKDKSKKKRKHVFPDTRKIKRKVVDEFRHTRTGVKF
jgi:ubiquinone/menaquinone biosynthesis C-methylase UbiE